MTLNVSMRGYKVFLASANKSLNNLKEESQLSDDNILYGTNIIVSCVACIESLINHIFIHNTDFKWSDELRLKSKIDVFYYLNGDKVDWGGNPFLMFSTIVVVRNWLIHYKDEKLGLAGCEGQWITDKYNFPPKYDPFHIFKKETCEIYYNATRQIVIALAKVAKLDESEYIFAETENYDYLINM